MISTKAQLDGQGRPYAHFDVSSSPRRRRWLRFSAILGTAPGSIGSGTLAVVWRSAKDGGRGGLNLRLLHSYRRPCLTVLLHWRGWRRGEAT